MKEPPLKRTVTLRRRPGPRTPPPTRDEIFREAFMVALGRSLRAIRDASAFMNRKPNFHEGDAELERCHAIVRRSWNIAGFAATAFEEAAQVRDFNSFLD